MARYNPPALATVDDFLTLDVRVGTVVSAEVLRGARKPAFALQVDFGALGVRQSSAQITDLYEPDDLVGLQVIAVVNLPPRRVAGFVSEVLVLAVDNGKGENVLLMPGAAGARRRPGELMAAPARLPRAPGADGRATGCARTLARMAHEILERHPGHRRGTVLVGVRTRGVPLARRLAALHRARRPGRSRRWAPSTSRSTATTSPPSRAHPVLKGTDIPVSIDGRTVVLVDDVLYTGPHRARRPRRADRLRPARRASSWRCWWTAATASCPSAPTTWARRSPPRARRSCR